MRLETSMGQRMSQEMHLAPRMIQSMEILQMPIMALEEKIQQELQENPVLELTQDADENFSETPEPAESPEDYAPESKVLDIDTSGQAESDFERLDSIPDDWKESFFDDHRPSRAASEEYSDRKHDAKIGRAHV